MTPELGKNFGALLPELNGVVEMARIVISEFLGMPLDTLPTVVIDPRTSADAIKVGIPPQDAIRGHVSGGNFEYATDYDVAPEVVETQARHTVDRWKNSKNIEQFKKVFGDEADWPSVAAHLAAIHATLLCLAVVDESDIPGIIEEVFRKVGKHKIGKLGKKV